MPGIPQSLYVSTSVQPAMPLARPAQATPPLPSAAPARAMSAGGPLRPLGSLPTPRCSADAMAAAAAAAAAEGPLSYDGPEEQQQEQQAQQAEQRQGLNQDSLLGIMGEDSYWQVGNCTGAGANTSGLHHGARSHQLLASTCHCCKPAARLPAWLPIAAGPPATSHQAEQQIISAVVNQPKKAQKPEVSGWRIVV